jgi:hypothetical protein
MSQVPPSLCRHPRLVFGNVRTVHLSYRMLGEKSVSFPRINRPQSFAYQTVQLMRHGCRYSKA